MGGALTPSLDLSGNYHDYFGRDVSISADGNTFVVSAPAWYGAGVDEGAIFTYDWNGSSWVQATPIYPHTLPLGVSGIGVNVELSPDGGTLAFSSAPHSLDTVRSGVVYVMQRSAGAWINPVRLTDLATYSTGGFGYSAALNHDGTILAVGDPTDVRVANNGGVVVIFRKLQAGWVHDRTIFPTVYSANSVFGWSVALNATGTHLLVGEPGYPSSLGRVEYLTAPSMPGAAWSTAFDYIAPGSQPIASGKSVAVSANAACWVVGEPASDLYGTNAGRVLVFETPCLEPNIYCVGQANSLGCVAEIEASGTPSVSSASGFVVSARNVRNQQNGMLIYSTSGRAQFAWQGGTLCVAPPLRRTPLVNSGGAAGASNNCLGVLSRDFNAWAYSAGDPALIVGQQVRAQFYSRDPGAVANVNLSNAIEFTLEP
ncbi:MAG: hypothetical protein HUU28_04615 [Planctomycetaceae bacterium]|nr:hypothetical protein [Planctomycetaceae bacterium]